MKYELGQLIFYLRENRVHSAPISTRMLVENEHDDWASTKEQKYLWQRFGESCVKYVTCHGEVMEECAFESREALAESLLNY